MSKHEERAARLVHRIEAFSDLVIGFSLALLGLTLVIPVHAASLYVHPWWLVSYFWTFAVIGVLWFNHQRLFSRYFVPTTPNIVVNFVLLSMVGLLVYFVQVFGHSATEYDRAIALLSYFTVLAVALLAMGTLFVLGTRAQWTQLDGEERYVGVRYGFRGVVIGVTILCGVFLTPILFLELDMRSTLTIGIAAACGGIVNRIVLGVLKPKITDQRHASV